MRDDSSTTASTKGRVGRNDSSAYAASWDELGTRRDGVRYCRASRVSARRSRSRTDRTVSQGGPGGGSGTRRTATSLLDVTDRVSKPPRTTKVVTGLPNESVCPDQLTGTGDTSRSWRRHCWTGVSRGRRWASL